MATLTPLQIYEVLRQAGFPPNAAVNFTAIAMAESSGRTDARLNTSAEDSRGLWQINLHAHPNYRNADLYDPLTNARAAYDISGGGRNLYPWSTTHHVGGHPASYERYLGVARQAAASAGNSVALETSATTTVTAAPHPDHVRPIEHGVLT